MKTTTYNTQKEIRIGLLVAIFTISIFTAFKVKELQLNGATNAHETRSSQLANTYNSFSSLPVLNARLIEEPALEIENWMTNDSYWGTETKSEMIEAEPELLIESWMTNSNYGTGANNEEVLEAEPELFIESWMTNSNYGTGASNEEVLEAEPELLIESWMMNESALTGKQPAIDKDEIAEEEAPLAIESWMSN